jgi:hypothetical protein
VSWPLRIPTPDQLAEAPELAAIELLDAALELTSNALLAENGELAFDDFALETASPPAIEAYLADAIINQVEALKHALHRYRDYVHAAPARHARLAQTDF